jgi:two-component sensor histidine kinase
MKSPLFAILILICSSFSVLYAQKEQATLDAILKMPNDTVKVDSLSHFGQKLEFSNQKISLKCQEEALRISQLLGDKRRTAREYYLLGCEEKILSKHSEALKHLQISYKLYDELGLYKKLIKTVNKMAQVFDDKQEYLTSIEYHQKTIDLSKKYDFEEYAGYGYSNIGDILSAHFNQYQKAIENYQKANVIFKKLGLKDVLCLNIMNEGGVYKRQKKYEKAFAKISEAMIYFKENNTFDGLGVASCNGLLGGIYLEKKEYKLAKNAIQESLNFYNKQDGYLDKKIDNLETLRKIYEAQNNIPAAYESLKKLRILNDTLNNQANQKSINTLKTQFETVQKEAQIKDLDEQNQTQKAKFAWAIGTLLLVSALLLLSIYLYRKLNHNKQKVERQSKALSTLMKELHHRVKNNLAIISSLLNMQSNRLEDKNAAKAVKEGQLRVQAMSMIHQRLYRTDNVSSVNIHTYLTDLSESLMQAYGYSHENFDLQISVENPELDVDLAIPIGLIVNELITNSFKYAYEGIARPLLKITFKNEGNIILHVQDNGIGTDEETMNKKVDSFGKNLIRGLSNQMRGVYKFEKRNGTFFELNIPKQAA